MHFPGNKPTSTLQVAGRPGAAQTFSKASRVPLGAEHVSHCLEFCWEERLEAAVLMLKTGTWRGANVFMASHRCTTRMGPQGPSDPHRLVGKGAQQLPSCQGHWHSAGMPPEIPVPGSDHPQGKDTQVPVVSNTAGWLRLHKTSKLTARGGQRGLCSPG